MTVESRRMRRLSPSGGKAPMPVAVSSDDERSEGSREQEFGMASAAAAAGGGPTPLSEHGALPWTGALVWPLLLAVPLVLSSHLSFTSYKEVFPSEWYEYDPATDKPKPLGLTLGVLAVAVGQVFVLAFFYLYRHRYLTRGVEPMPIQARGARPYEFAEGVQTHLSQPEGFVLLVAYLSVTWVLDLMPKSYYSFEGSIQWGNLFACLVTQDGIQYGMHMLEHRLSPTIYQKSHKPHHRFTNPRMFDAFNGSLTDTILMILIPLFSTANIVRGCNVWTYMAFGSMYANWLTMIHSEYALPWDGVFRRFGLGTAGDHHVHHKVFKYNFGHLFMWFDMLGGTYRRPEAFAPKLFNVGA